MLGVPVVQPTWFERKGRRVLGWGAGLVLAALVVGTGAWVVRDRQDTAALAAVAGAVKPALRFAPYVAPAPSVAPPLVLARPDPAPAAPAPEMDDARQVDFRVADAPDQTDDEEQPAAVGPALAPAVTPVKTPPPVARKEKPKQPAARKQDQPKQEVTKKDKPRSQVRPPKPAARESAKVEPRKPDKAKPASRATPAVAPASSAAAESAAALSQAETLRQCRAAGYHATRCMRRGCVATKFGLACRG